jgi:hypothetical protein
MTQLCDPYFWEDPRHIFSFQWMYTKGGTRLCKSNLVNELAFLFLLYLVVSGLLLSTGNTVASAVPIALFVGLMVYILGFWFPFFRAPLTAMLVQGFDDPPAGPVAPPADEESEESTGPEKEVVVPTVLESFQDAARTMPTAGNPFMNVLVSEITGWPAKAPSADITATETKMGLDDFFRVQWSSDPTDVFGKKQSQREFYTVPGASVPNDQGSYQNWLYRIPGKTCKEGGRENCLPGTDGGPLPWLNQDR